MFRKIISYKFRKYNGMLLWGIIYGMEKFFDLFVVAFIDVIFVYLKEFKKIMGIILGAW